MLAVSPDVQAVCHPSTATISVGPHAGRGASRVATLALHGLNHSPGACRNEDSQKFWFPRMCRAQKLAFAIRVFGNSNSRGSENHFFFFFFFKKSKSGASLVAQWLRIRLPMQGTRVQSLVREDPTCHGATKPRASQLLSLCSRAREPQLLSPRAATTEACAPRARAPQQEKPPQ